MGELDYVHFSPKGIDWKSKFNSRCCKHGKMYFTLIIVFPFLSMEINSPYVCVYSIDNRRLITTIDFD